MQLASTRSRYEQLVEIVVPMFYTTRLCTMKGHSLMFSRILCYTQFLTVKVHPRLSVSLENGGTSRYPYLDRRQLPFLSACSQVTQVNVFSVMHISEHSSAVLPNSSLVLYPHMPRPWYVVYPSPYVLQPWKHIATPSTLHISLSTCFV